MTEAVYEAGSWIYKMLVTLVLAVVCVGIIGIVVKAEANTVDLQRELLFNRILYDPQGIVYSDSVAVAHPGIIDEQRFAALAASQDEVNKAFTYPAGYGGASVVLIDAGGQKGFLINAPTFTMIQTAVTAQIKNGGTTVTRSYPITVIDGTNRHNGILIITVAMPTRA